MTQSNSDRFDRQAGLVPRNQILRELVTVIGVGAIGRQAALQLTAIGVPKLQLIDFDRVESANVTTQGYLIEDLGRPKVVATAEMCQRMDSLTEIEAIQDRFRPTVTVGSSVFLCVDSISTRATIWRAIESRTQFFADGRMLGETIGRPRSLGGGNICRNAMGPADT